MANRVTAAELQEIISTSLSESVLDAFITGANLIVTEHLGDSEELSSAQLKEIERWLSAHLLACTRERQAKSENVKDASISYMGDSGKGLDATLYGQQVKLMDTSGVLAEVVGKKRATLYAIRSFE